MDSACPSPHPLTVSKWESDPCYVFTRKVKEEEQNRVCEPCRQWRSQPLHSSEKRNNSSFWECETCFITVSDNVNKTDSLKYDCCYQSSLTFSCYQDAHLTVKITSCRHRWKTNERKTIWNKANLDAFHGSALCDTVIWVWGFIKGHTVQWSLSSAQVTLVLNQESKRNLGVFEIGSLSGWGWQTFFKALKELTMSVDNQTNVSKKTEKVRL